MYFFVFFKLLLVLWATEYLVSLYGVPGWHVLCAVAIISSVLVRSASLLIALLCVVFD